MTSPTAFHFTKVTIDKLPLPPKGKRKYYRDTKEKGLIIDVRETGSKSFYLYKWVNGKPDRIFIGSFPDVSLEQARKSTVSLRADIAKGESPQDKKREAKQEMNLGDLFNEYMNRYSKIHKKSWKYDEREIKRFLSHWFDRKLSDIPRADIRRLHEDLYLKNGLYQANRMLERIRAMYNKAIEWDWQGVNPAIGIKKYREKSRDRFIQPFEMPHIVNSINAEVTNSMKDYFWLLLLIGARKKNTIMMRWEEISWDRFEWRIPDTKNGDPLTVPLTEKAIEILKNRLANSNSAWVFPQEANNTKHIVNEKRAWQRIRDRATIYMWRENPQISSWMKTAEKLSSEEYPYDMCMLAKIKNLARVENIQLPPTLQDIRVHDIRRTFGSYQAITGASMQIIGRSLGHKSTQSTQIYARLNLDPVRAAVDKATAAMFAFQANN